MLGHLKHTEKNRLHYRGNDVKTQFDKDEWLDMKTNVYCFSDTDWASDNFTRPSTSVILLVMMVVLLHGNCTCRPLLRCESEG